MSEKEGPGGDIRSEGGGGSRIVSLTTGVLENKQPCSQEGSRTRDADPRAQERGVLEASPLLVVNFESRIEERQPKQECFSRKRGYSTTAFVSGGGGGAASRPERRIAPQIAYACVRVTGSKGGLMMEVET